jgi:hypothetical protein
MRTTDRQKSDERESAREVEEWGKGEMRGKEKKGG